MPLDYGNVRAMRKMPHFLPQSLFAIDSHFFPARVQIFIAQVARKADEKDLFAFFSDCGKVHTTKRITPPVARSCLHHFMFSFCFMRS
jgi:hypothetical protein